jgi:predicted SAM-dependent methyltransferase
MGESQDGGEGEGEGGAKRKSPAKYMPTKPIQPTVHITAASSGESVYESMDSTVEDLSESEQTVQEQNTTPPSPSQYSSIPDNIFDGRYILLNIGGFMYKESWYNVNSQNSETEIILSTGHKIQMNVDITRMMDDLYGFPDNSVSAIYASHILEHASHGDGYNTGKPCHILRTLREWHRVLRPGGLLMISVPDLPTLFQLYLRPNMTIQDKWLLTRVIYGAQSDEYDYHKVGFDESILTNFLKYPFQPTSHDADEDTGTDTDTMEQRLHNAGAGFCSITRVKSFGLFQDSSEISLFGTRISLNLASKKCKVNIPSDSSGAAGYTLTEADRDFQINMSGSLYDSPVFPQKELCEACDCRNVQEEKEEEEEEEDNDENDSLNPPSLLFFLLLLLSLFVLPLLLFFHLLF